MEERRLIAVCLCLSLLVPVIPRPVEAGDRSKIVEVTPGQPAIWSLGQAHYLLANMHQRNRDLSTKLPNEDTLDPNRANSSRLETLRRALSLEAQFDESIGVKNDLEMQRFRNEQNRQEQTRIQLVARRADLAELDRELLTLNEDLARFQEEDRQSTEARNAIKPPTPPTTADNDRKLKIEVLKVRKAQKEGEKARLESEITSLNTAATTNPTGPTLQTSALTTTSGGLPESTAFDKFVEDALSDFNQPTLAASTALDNFIGMQYEIIAKQLTLLRDEVGPDERVIFLELPASIYSVDGRADDYVAQVEWEVTRYFDKVPQKSSRTGKCPEQSETKEDRTQTDKSRYTDSGSKYEIEQSLPVTLDMILQAASAASNVTNPRSESTHLSTQGEKALRSAEGGAVLEEDGFRSLRVRALDIIPRQSALNVNEYHATVKNTGLIGVLKLLSGFGAKVDFQNQREMYEQFMQQEVFASGYGKGTHIFGWTFGPQPGTRRVAPGQRTTYAVLAVPRDTLALELVPRTRVFRRHQSPRNERPGKPLVVRVPGAQTDGFWIDRISYAPVTKGARVTLVLEGKYFSPQLGVMVNGVPLQRVISITRTGSKEATPTSASGIQGEYELINSRQMVLSFGMGSDYTGTPIITLVTPDKSAALNFFRLAINARECVSLQRLSAFEPMFLDEASVTSKLEVIEEFTVGDKTFVGTRLSGKGLRPSASVFVDNKPLKEVDPLEATGPGGTPTTIRDIQSRFSLPSDEPFFAQESVGTYILYFEQPSEKSAIRYQQRTRQGLEEFNFDHTFKSPFSHKIRNYRRGFRGGPAEVDLTITSRDNKVINVHLDGLQGGNPAISGGCLVAQPEGTANFRVKCFVPPLANRIERDFVTLKVERPSDTKFIDIDLPVQPVVANVVNPRTGNASGFADEQPIVVISGIHLRNVTAVIFGEQVVKLPASGAAESIAVKVPKIEGIPRGQSIVVPVLFQTSIDGETKIPSGAFYTFFGPPLEPNLIAWPCHPGAPCPQAAGGKP